MFFKLEYEIPNNWSINRLQVLIHGLREASISLYKLENFHHDFSMTMKILRL